MRPSITAFALRPTVATQARESVLSEHWDTIEAIPARSEWKNQNGKF